MQAGEVRQRQPLHIVIVGHVDHGKSTFVGRLLYETGALPPEKVEQVRQVSERRGQRMEWAFLLDAFQAERDQGITIDVSRIVFKTDFRPYVIIDAPGHKEFIKNMVTGAADAEAALLIVDASEGVQEQTRRHAYLLHLLGIEQVLVVVTKMDLVGFSEWRFREIESEITRYLGGLGIEPQRVVPISAQTADNITTRSTAMPWYSGPAALDVLDRLQPRQVPRLLPMRMPVQDVYRFDARRLIAGRVEAGTLGVGDELLFSPSGKTARVASIEGWNVSEPPTGASAGQSIALTLDQQIFVERGEVASHVVDPPKLTNVFRGRLFWFGARPLTVGQSLKLRVATADHMATVQAIESIIDPETLAHRESRHVERNEVAEVVLRTRGLIPLDEARDSPRTGRFVLIDDYRIVGGGIISMEGYPDQRELVTVRSTNVLASKSIIDRETRWARNGHRGAVLWLTGLSGAGKSTIAVAAERRLFDLGYNVFVLDGDNLRHGLNANLGFSPEDRAENIRRAGEVAALFAEAGMVVIASFISPYVADRERARKAGGDSFHEVYVSAPLEVCERRDPKGLYRRARTGEIPEFTGISAPYEPPGAPDLLLDTAVLGADDAVDRLVEYVRREIAKA